MWGKVSITVSMDLTDASIPPATFVMRHIVSKFCSMSRGYYHQHRVGWRFATAVSGCADRPLMTGFSKLL
jgi:hypothetical protein